MKHNSTLAIEANNENTQKMMTWNVDNKKCTHINADN